MKRIVSLLTLFGLMLPISCFDPPNFPIVPRITFKGVKIINVADPLIYDTLTVSVSFQDGDGDLGRSGTETDPPFNSKWYYFITPKPSCEPNVPAPCYVGSYINVNSLQNVVLYSTRRTNPNYDTLPEYENPYSCLNYEILKNESNVTLDTVYFQ